jgi:uncharacterized membrane protein YhaH (DUF805 family)
MTMSGEAAPVAKGLRFRNLSALIPARIWRRLPTPPPEERQERGIAMEYMFLPLKRYAEFSGRSRRMEFWMFTLFQIILWCVFVVLAMTVLGSALMAGGSGSVGGIMAAGGSAMILLAVGVIVALALFIPGLAVAMRRLHDTDRSGWWVGGYLLLVVASNFVRASTGSGGISMILSLVTLIYAITLIVFYCLDGTKGPNKYGPDPKGQVDAEVFA